MIEGLTSPQLTDLSLAYRGAGGCTPYSATLSSGVRSVDNDKKVKNRRIYERVKVG